VSDEGIAGAGSSARQNPRWVAPAAAIVSGVIIIVGQGIGGSTPEPSASGSDVITFYTAHANAELASGVLTSLGALVFLLFAAALYGILKSASSSRTAAAFSLGGGVVLTIGLTVFAGISIALGDSIGRMSEPAAQAINLVGLVDIFAVTIGTSAFLLGAGAASLGSGALPKWLAWIAVLLGLVATIPSHVLGGVLDHIGFVPFAGLTLWLIATGIVLALRSDSVASR